mmetsp:Transcript_16560/g.28217  ORF Transcript_16560/g.28217 Transcript_16560/m.28217 type:complete len:279 (-) Transcript_16560:2-838(-)
MSNLPLILAKRRQPTSLARSAGVSASFPNGVPASSHALTASSVSARKTLPFDQATARGNSFWSLATVVPLPVPESPCRTRMQPRDGASPSAARISAATVSALLPVTSMRLTGSTATRAGTTCFATAISMPAASFSSSSLSRARMSRISRLANFLKTGSDSKAAMTPSDAESSPFSRSARLSGSAVAAPDHVELRLAIVTRLLAVPSVLLLSMLMTSSGRAFFFLPAGRFARKTCPHASQLTAVTFSGSADRRDAPHCGQSNAYDFETTKKSDAIGSFV